MTLIALRKRSRRFSEKQTQADDLEADNDGKLEFTTSFSTTSTSAAMEAQKIREDSKLKGNSFKEHKIDPKELNRANNDAIPAHGLPLEFKFEHVQKLQKLGRGSFGDVYLVEVNQAKVALKLLVQQVMSASGALDDSLGEDGNNFIMPRALVKVRIISRPRVKAITGFFFLFLCIFPLLP